MSFHSQDVFYSRWWLWILIFINIPVNYKLFLRNSHKGLQINASKFFSPESFDKRRIYQTVSIWLNSLILFRFFFRNAILFMIYIYCSVHTWTKIIRNSNLLLRLNYKGLNKICKYCLSQVKWHLHHLMCISIQISLFIFMCV